MPAIDSMTKKRQNTQTIACARFLWRRQLTTSRPSDGDQIFTLGPNSWLLLFLEFGCIDIVFRALDSIIGQRNSDQNQTTNMMLKTSLKHEQDQKGPYRKSGASKSKEKQCLPIKTDYRKNSSKTI
eukprot:2846094-Amphidinium_carterae.1